MTPASVSEQSGQRSATRIPIVAEIARPRNGWRGHAVSSFTFRGEKRTSSDCLQLFGDKRRDTHDYRFIYPPAESPRRTRYLSSQICSLEESRLCLEGYPQT